MNLDRERLQQLWGAPRVPASAEAFGAVSTDSRQLPAGCLFLPLVGERFDGHGFLDQAVASGCGAVLAQADRLAPAALAALERQAALAGCGLWLVPDTLLAYQQLAGLCMVCSGIAQQHIERTGATDPQVIARNPNVAVDLPRAAVVDLHQAFTGKQNLDQVAATGIHSDDLGGHDLLL